MLSFKSAGAVSSRRRSQSQASRQGKGKLLQSFLTPALHGAVCAAGSQLHNDTFAAAGSIPLKVVIMTVGYCIM